MKKIRLTIPLLCYLSFSFIVILAYLYYRPSWGLESDWQYIEGVNGIWSSSNILKSIFDYVKAEFFGEKIRPLYCIYTLVAYRFFNSAPYLIYILIFVIQISILPLWGLIFHRMFSKEGLAVSQETLFIFPLSFFIFTPFWNNFMYISLQEKMVFIFGSLAVYFFMLAFNKNRIRDALISLGFALLCLFSKPTGVYLFLAFSVCLLLYCLIYRKNIIYPVIFLFICLALLVGYYLFVKSLVKPGGYSSRYIENFNIIVVLNQLKHASIAIKGLLAVALAFLVSYLVLIKKRYYNFSSVIIPVALISYFLVLLPWGLINYLLGPVTPFALGIFFPVYSSLKRRLNKFNLSYLPGTVIILLTCLVLTQIIIPRINKMAEIKDVEEEIPILKNNSTNPRFYFPPYYSETCFALSKFTNTEIVYLPDAVLDSTMLSEGDNYLIYRDECSSINLKNVKIEKTIFENKTWKIFQIGKSNNKGMLNIKFPQTILQKVIRFINRS